MAGERSYFLKESVVRGHHLYKHIWTAGISEELSVEKEPGNLHDNLAASVVKNDYTVGHVPRSLSKVTWFFLTQGGTVTCQITRRRKLGISLEVPCLYVYHGRSKDVEILKKMALG